MLTIAAFDREQNVPLPEIQMYRFFISGAKNRVFKGDKFVLESLEKARSEVDRAIQQTKEKLAKFKPKSPADLLALFRFPSPDALEIARSAEIFEVAIDLIQKNVDTGLMLKDMNQ